MATANPETPILESDPFQKFRKWFGEADEAQSRGELKMHEAMSLATVSPDGQPSSRMVLFKGMSGEGFTFHTNYHSRKVREIDANPAASLLFYWAGLERQIRIEGRLEKLPAAESDRYWATRARESNIGAWASHQSSPVTDRAELLAQVGAIHRKFPGDGPIPRPDFWGGFRLMPSRIEFWIAGEYRLHDRFVYTRGADGTWQTLRLSP